jgi:natural product biosynthesis luciferase-like monooxygenase protein
MEFGLMFFSSEQAGTPGKYDLMLECARAADEGGFCGIWTPERHFDEFGGIYANPAVTSAAIAMVTQAVQIRAGSLISPIHDSIRIAEEWSMVDNLSGGRAAISFGAGWNVNDFVFYPDRYASRHAVMAEQIETVRRLWAGDTITRINSFGRDVKIQLRPQPVQSMLPIWVTSSGNPTTFEFAGTIGANVLTHLIGQDLTALSERVALYRKSRANNGHNPDDGIVTLMLHTFLCDDPAMAVAIATPGLRRYLRSAVHLEKRAAEGGGNISCGFQLPDSEDGDDAEVMEELLTLTCHRYMASSLIGSSLSCRPLVEQVASSDVDEIACLVDFGVPSVAVLDGIGKISELRKSCTSPKHSWLAHPAKGLL